MKLSIAFSPCPNDTFIFDALVNGKIDTGGIEFDVHLEDVETLNRWALEERHDVTKLSFPALFNVIDKYSLLNAGSALGNGVGPLLVSRNFSSFPAPGSTIALPGEHTTANLLFSFAFPGKFERRYLLFSDIEDAVVNGEMDYGVIIHENRFTYHEKGLHEVMDLGTHWEKKMQMPIPLGGIAMRRSWPEALAQEVDRLIRKSLEFAFANYPDISQYTRDHAQSMSETVMRKHIALYVNEYSLDLTDKGRAAIKALEEVFWGKEG